MSLLSFLEHLATADASAQPAPRRDALTQLARSAAAVALPAALGALAPTQAAAQTSGTILDALLTALRVEWLQDEFYGRVLGAIPVSPLSPTLVPAAIQPDLTLIRSQQRQHITLLTSFIQASGGAIGSRPNYDFTGGRGGARPALFADVFTSTDTMLRIAQALEDLSVRTYIGLTPLLQSSNALIDLVVRMLPVEGRHAAHLRRLRQQRSVAIKTWISGTDGLVLPTASRNIYAGEDTVNQPTAALFVRDASTLLPRTGGITQAEILAATTEAFDEPLSLTAAAGIIGEFTY